MSSAFDTTIKSAADLNVQRRVLLTLGQLHVPLFRFLHVDVTDGVVTLSGRVGSYYERQLAQSRARRVPGVIRLVDALIVVERTGESGSLAGLLTRTATKRHSISTSDLALPAADQGERSQTLRDRRIA